MAGIRLTLLLALLLVAASKGNVINSEALQASDNPVFEVTRSRSMDEPPSITVSFANGVKDELILTHYKMHENSKGGCNYLGRLRSSPSSSTAVTGCLNNPGDRMEVTLISEHNTNQMFTVDFFGNTEIIKNPFGDGVTSRAITIDRDDGGWHKDDTGDEEINEVQEAEVETAKAVTIPSKLKAVVKFGLEQGLQNSGVLGSQGFAAWIEGVFTHTQVYYRHSSLGTEIEFEVQGAPLYMASTYWTADDNIDNARAATLSANLNGVDTMSWWCPTGGGGVAGIAYLGGLCQSNGINTNLNEAQGTKAASGFVLAHELGHNFGMSHDFDAKHGGEGGHCDKQGIMSYGSYDFNKWSTCSRSDWEQHYASRNWGNGCLEDVSGGNNNGGCSDRSGGYRGQYNCAQYISLCNDATYPDFKDDCKKTCGQCGGGGGGGGVQNQGQDCWGQCGNTPECSYCGTGVCCRKTSWSWWNMWTSVCNSSTGGDGYHACVAA